MSVPNKKIEGSLQGETAKMGDMSGKADESGSYEEPGFQESLKRLEAIVDRLESGELSLEESLSEFEKGVRLARRLQSFLSRAEQKVQEIMKENEPKD